MPCKPVIAAYISETKSRKETAVVLPGAAAWDEEKPRPCQHILVYSCRKYFVSFFINLLIQSLYRVCKNIREKGIHKHCQSLKYLQEGTFVFYKSSSKKSIMILKPLEDTSGQVCWSLAKTWYDFDKCKYVICPLSDNHII